MVLLVAYNHTMLQWRNKGERGGGGVGEGVGHPRTFSLANVFLLHQ